MNPSPTYRAVPRQPLIHLCANQRRLECNDCLYQMAVFIADQLDFNYDVAAGLAPLDYRRNYCFDQCDVSRARELRLKVMDVCQGGCAK